MVVILLLGKEEIADEKKFKAIVVNIVTAVVVLGLGGVVGVALYRLARLILGLGCDC